MRRRKVLFICWDAPHVTYLEGLFLPIFEDLGKKGFEFHVIQFSWAGKEKVTLIGQKCMEKLIQYVHVRIETFPAMFIGKLLALARGPKLIASYVKNHQIDIVIPRSTMPAKMLLAIVMDIPDCKIVFDADGLPIEERVDLTGLKVGSIRYRVLKDIEQRMLHRADLVLTRTMKAASLLAVQHGMGNMEKFYVVRNGRDGNFFRRASNEKSAARRASLGIPGDALVLVYCGSLGPQYGIAEMGYIHRQLQSWNAKTYLLLLVTNPAYSEKSLLLKAPNIVVKSVPFAEVPLYLSIGNVGLAIREPLYSMQGVAPIKLGEYLLIGLPVVASAGIGDSEEQLSDRKFAFLLRDHSQDQLDLAVKWIKGLGTDGSVEAAARLAGERDFDLEKSVLSYETALTSI
jgi:hypothetical protein